MENSNENIVKSLEEQLKSVSSDLYLYKSLYSEASTKLNNLQKENARLYALVKTLFNTYVTEEHERSDL